jgi:hypothetical protein
VGVAPIEACEGALSTTRDDEPIEPENTALPEYVPVIVSLPTGAAAEVHEPLPLTDSVAVQSAVDPVVNATDPCGVGIPTTFVVTVAE